MIFMIQKMALYPAQLAALTDMKFATITEHKNFYALTVKSGFSVEAAKIRLRSLGIQWSSLDDYLGENVQPVFMYGIASPDGRAYMDEFCVCIDRGELEEAVSTLNSDAEPGEEYQVVELFTHINPALARLSASCDVFHLDKTSDNKFRLYCSSPELGEYEQQGPLSGVLLEAYNQFRLGSKKQLGNCGFCNGHAYVKELDAKEQWQKIKFPDCDQHGNEIGGIGFDPSGGDEATVIVRHVAPAGWKLVPIEPTERMVIDGFESAPTVLFSKLGEWEAYEAMSGCQRAAHLTRLCWAAMLAAAPEVE